MLCDYFRKVDGPLQEQLAAIDGLSEARPLNSLPRLRTQLDKLHGLTDHEATLTSMMLSLREVGHAQMLSQTCTLLELLQDDLNVIAKVNHTIGDDIAALRKEVERLDYSSLSEQQINALEYFTTSSVARIGSTLEEYVALAHGIDALRETDRGQSI